MSIIKGNQAEEQAKHYLLSQGLRWLESNFRCKCGEIDLIMKEDDSFVFVEVRSRSSSLFGDAVMSVNKSKQQKLLKTAAYYCVLKKLNARYALRFDVVALHGTRNIEWIKNAFGTDF